MAQLKDTIIFGDLEVLGELKLAKGISSNISSIGGDLTVHGRLTGIAEAYLAENKFILNSERLDINVPTFINGQLSANKLVLTETDITTAGKLDVTSTNDISNYGEDPNYDGPALTVAGGAVIEKKIKVKDVATFENNVFPKRIYTSGGVDYSSSSKSDCDLNSSGGAYVAKNMNVDGNLYEKDSRVWTRGTLSISYDTSSGTLVITTA